MSSINSIKSDTVRRFGRVHDRNTVEKITDMAGDRVERMSQSISDSALPGRVVETFKSVVDEYGDQYGFVDLGILILILRIVIWVLGNWTNKSDSAILRDQGDSD